MQLVLVACSQKGGETVTSPGLLTTVPSDAVAIAKCDKCSDALEALLGPSDALRSLNYGKLSSAPAVLSLMYVSKLSPLLAIDTGKESSNEPESLGTLVREAEEKHIFTAIVPHNGRRILLLATSGTVMPLAHRHLEIGASVLDAPGFGTVVRAASSSDRVLMFRNHEAKRLLAGGIMQTLGLQDMESSLTRKALSDFLPEMCDWTLLDLDGEKIVTGHDGGLRQMDVLIGQLGETVSTIPVPENCNFLLDIQTDGDFRTAYENWLDAGSRLESYLKTLKTLRKESGKKPLDWEKELGVKEVARICWDGHDVAVLATKRKPAEDITAPVENPYKSFIYALYSNLRVPDSHYSRIGNLVVFGTPEDIGAYLLCTQKEPIKGKFKVRLISGITVITADKQETKLTQWSSNQ